MHISLSFRLLPADPIISILYWNYRGIGNNSSKRVLSDLCCSHRHSLVCISEPLVAFDSISARFWSSLGLHLVGMNDRGGLIPSIWVFACDSISDPQIVLCDKQHLIVSISIGSMMYWYTFVYASTSASVCHVLWHSLREMAGSFSSSWLVVGDFNAVFGAHECLGSRSPAKGSCKDFKSMNEDCNLIGVRSQGARFTWVRGRSSHTRVERRLDKTLVSEGYTTCWRDILCVALPRQFSDHYQLWIRLAESHVSTSRPFRFQSMWVDYPDFMNLVRKSEMVTSRHRNSSFFHSSIKCRQCRSVLSSLLIDGVILVDQTVIKDHIVRFSVDLFSSDSNLIDQNLSIVDDIVPSLVSQEENSLLMAIPSPDVIHDAVFAMDALSAPGLDGFSNRFFQRCWEIVGRDVILEVQDFFHSGVVTPGLNSNFIFLSPKMRDSITIDQFRPIMLGNFLFKVSSKILADRGNVGLSLCNNLVSSGIGMLRIVLLSSDCVNVLHEKCYRGNVAMKIDICEALKYS
ncbi:hypothetical protein Dsin_021784 [Dipteronia sinensis]|uniref:Reverse transcriptase n=1 Tax=Dipteronia sinensis TaxID=43782 RepID=A0AAE0DZF5_9ROSI|nr:hypothetical protein Dsin_021784 [Dipteronia sinensis]